MHQLTYRVTDDCSHFLGQLEISSPLNSIVRGLPFRKGLGRFDFDHPEELAWCQILLA